MTDNTIVQTTLVLLLASGAVSYGQREANSPKSAEKLVERGMKRFRDNKIAESIADFEAAAKRDPKLRPHLWQLGISYYYAGKFLQGKRLFESHRTVNPHDVENAAWHFLCAARAEGLESARKKILPIETRRDTRIPMAEVYALYSGKGTADDVLAAAAKAGTARAKMYAHLYVGLYDEVTGKTKEAREHLRQAAAVPLKNHYMHDVARVHLLQRDWK